MASWPKVTVVGPGGVGAYFGGMLARAGAPVTVLGRPGDRSAHLEALARDGLRLRALSFDARVPVHVADSVEAIAGAELVLFSVKSTDTERAACRIAPHLSRDAVVVALQNGVENPARLRQAGIDAVPAVVYIAAAVEAPGEVTHRGRGDLVIGHASRRADLERVAAWFESAGVPCRISEDIELEMWIKLILNSMANAVSALTDSTYGELAAFEPTWNIALEVAREGTDVARALGHELDLDGMIARGRSIVDAVGAATSSTQQDIARGRLTEIDDLNGTIERRGAELGIPTPVNRVLWALVKLRERAAARNR